MRDRQEHMREKTKRANEPCRAIARCRDDEVVRERGHGAHVVCVAVELPGQPEIRRCHDYSAPIINSRQ